MKRIVLNKNNIQVVYNGKIYLAKNLNISTQYLGSGASAFIAIDSMNETIKRLNLKKLEVSHNET